MSKEQQIYKKNFLHLSPDLGACLHSVLFASALASTYTRFFSAERLLASWRWYQCKWTRTGSKLSSILLVFYKLMNINALLRNEMDQELAYLMY
ncbi:hypothetical protein MANES_09G055050v8 [Manihot esculenta]|uniref:Uncharacterized protein n=1 Tax=Manihot esculenta TaxID=3983 RepID=A0ACB7H470_MANES|nr:hypothetical protein MANES_09G055050v8 [Manihot esculenta]